MANGIAGDTSGINIGGLPYQDLQIVELRTISAYLQAIASNSSLTDDQRLVRNDEAQALGIPVPIAGQ